MIDELEDFLIRTRKTTSSPFDEKIKKHSESSGLDEDLVRRMAGQESGGDPNAKSWAGNQGLLQISDDIAKRFVKQEEFGTLDPKNPDVNLAGGTRYYKWLLDRYKGDHKRALAGYNAGEGNADKNDWWEKSLYWSNDPDVQAGRKPRGEADKTNTRNYIEKITNGYSGNGYKSDELALFLKKHRSSQPDELESFLNKYRSSGDSAEIENKPVPEPKFAIDQQVLSAIDPNSLRSAVLLTEQRQYANLPPEQRNLFTPIFTKAGNLIVNNEKAKKLNLTTPEQIYRYVEKNGFTDLIGKVDDFGDQTGEGIALRTEDEHGRELSTSRVNPESIEAQAATDAAAFPNAAKQEVLTAQDAVNKREEENALENFYSKNIRLTGEHGENYIQVADQSGLQENQIRLRNTANDKGGIVIATKATGADGKEIYSLQSSDNTPPQNKAVSKNQPKKNAVLSGSSDADYKIWLDYKNRFEGANLTDSHAARAQFHKELADSENFGSGVEVEAQTDAPTLDAETVEAYKDSQNLPKLSEGVEANTNAEKLAGEANSVKVDVSGKPKGVNAGRYLLNQALKKVAPQYGLTDSEIDAYTTGDVPANNFWDKINDDNFDAALESLKAQGKNNLVDVHVTNENINDILQKRSGGNRDEINPELQTEIGLKENTLRGGLEKNFSNNRIIRGEEESEAKTRAELKQPSFSDSMENSAKNALTFAGQSFISPFYAGYNQIRKLGEEIENQFLSDDERIAPQVEKIRQQYGGKFSEYQKDREYYSQMSAPETAARMLAEAGRGLVRTSVSDILKGVDFLDAVAEKNNPLIRIVPENYRPTVRNLGNYLAYSIAYLQNPNTAKNLEFASADSDVDKRLFYNVGKLIDENLGEDKYLRDRFLGQASNAAGTGLGFVLLGFVAPEASISTRLGEFSLTSAGLGAVTGAGSGYDEAKQQGLSEDQATAYGIANGVLNLTEGFGIGASLNRAIKDASLRKVFLSSFLDFTKEKGGALLKGAGEEALQEFVQTTGGKVALEAIKDKDPSSYQRIVNIINRLPSQAAETIAKEVPVAALTGGLFETATHLAAGESSSSPRVDYKNNLIELDGKRYSFDESLKPTVESWVNQQNGIDAVYSEMADLKTKAQKAKTTEQRELILKQADLLQREAAALVERDKTLMREIEQGLKPLESKKTLENKEKDSEAEEIKTDSVAAEEVEAPQPVEKTETETENNILDLKPIKNDFEIGQKVEIKNKGAGVIVEQKGDSFLVDFNPKENKSGETSYQSRAIFNKRSLTGIEETAVPNGAEIKEPRKFSSTQIDIPAKTSSDIQTFAKKLIPESELTGDGYEDKPHITTKFGLHSDSVSPEVESIVRNTAPFDVTLGKVSVFDTNPDFDVVKIDVDSPELRELNKKLSELPNGDEHPTYKPHLTLAYVKKGEGQKYIGNTEFEGKKVPFDALTFSAKDRTKTQLKFEGKNDAAGNTATSSTVLDEKNLRKNVFTKANGEKIKFEDVEDFVIKKGAVSPDELQKQFNLSPDETNAVAAKVRQMIGDNAIKTEPAKNEKLAAPETPLKQGDKVFLKDGTEAVFNKNIGENKAEIIQDGAYSQVPVESLKVKNSSDENSSQSNVVNGNLNLTVKGHSLLKNAVKDKTDFKGRFNNPTQARELLENVENFIKENPENPDISDYKTLAKNIEKIVSSGKGSIIVYKDAKSLPHETGHKISYENAKYDEKTENYLQKRIADFDDFTSRHADKIQNAHAKFFSKLGIGENERGRIVEEMQMEIITGNRARLGLTVDEAAEFADDWFNAYEKQNGEQGLKEFGEIFDYARERINGKRTGRKEEKTADDADISTTESRENARTEIEDNEKSDSASGDSEPKNKERLAAFSRIAGEEFKYNSQSHEETAERAQQLISDKGTQQAFFDALNLSAPSAESMQIVYWEFQRLNALADEHKKNGREAEYKSLIEDISHLGSQIALKQIQLGQATEIAKTLSALRPESALLTATKIKKSVRNDQNAELTAKQAEDVKKIAQELETANAALLKAETEISELQRKIKKLESSESKEKPKNSKPQEKLLNDLKAKEKAILNSLKSRFPDSALFDGSKATSVQNAETKDTAAALNSSSPVISIDEKTAENLTEFATLKILTGESYENLINTLSELTGLAVNSDELQQIHSDAVEIIKPAAKPVSEEAKKRIKIRREHYSESEKYLKSKEPNAHLSPIAREMAQNEKYKNNSNLIFAVNRLTDNQARDFSSVIKDIAGNLKLSVNDARTLAANARETIKIIKAERQAKIDEAKGILPEKRKELNQAYADKAKASLKLNQMLQDISANPNAMKRANNSFRAKLISNVGTQAFNLIQAVSVQMTQELFTDLVESALRIGMRKANGSDIFADVSPEIRLRDAFLPFWYLKGFNKQAAEQILAQYPEEYFKIFNWLVADVDLDGRKLADEQTNKISKGLHKIFDKDEKLNEFLAKYSFAQTQETYVRLANFIASIDQSLKSRGVSLKQVLDEGTLRENISQADTQRAADRALRVTVAELMNETKFERNLKQFYDWTDNFLPVFLNPVVYARFTFTVSKAIANAHTFGLFDSQKLGGRGYDARSFSKGVYGYSAVYVASALLKSFGGDDDKWNTLYLFGKDNPPLDVRRFYPLSAYFYTAHLLNNEYEGRPRPTAKDLAEGYASLDLDLYGRSAGVDLIDSLASFAEGSEINATDKLAKNSARFTGNIIAAIFRVFKPFRDIYAQFDQEEATMRDYKTSPDKFIEEIARVLPVGRLYGAPAKQNPVTGENIVQPFPAGRLIGVNLIHPQFTSPKQTVAEEWADIYWKQKRGGEMSDDELQAFRARKELKEEVRSGKTTAENLFPRIKELIKAGKLTEKSADILRDDLKLSDLQENFKRNYKVNDPESEKISEALRAMMSERELNEVRPIIEAKMKTADKRKALANRSIYEVVKPMPTDKAVEFYKENESDLSEKQKEDFKAFLKQKAENANKAGKLTDDEIDNIKKVMPNFTIIKSLPSGFKSLPSAYGNKYESLKDSGSKSTESDGDEIN